MGNLYHRHAWHSTQCTTAGKWCQVEADSQWSHAFGQAVLIHEIHLFSVIYTIHLSRFALNGKNSVKNGCYEIRLIRKPLHVIWAERNPAKLDSFSSNVASVHSEAYKLFSDWVIQFLCVKNVTSAYTCFSGVAYYCCCIKYIFSTFEH
jgi:hypothetical protein